MHMSYKHVPDDTTHNKIISWQPDLLNRITIQREFCVKQFIHNRISFMGGSMQYMFHN